MAEQEPPADQPKVSVPGAAEAEARAQREDEQRGFAQQLLEIVDHEIGRGEERDPAVWAAIRQTATDHMGGDALVEKLGDFLSKCTDELKTLGEKGDVSSVRASMMKVVRDMVSKRYGV